MTHIGSLPRAASRPTKDPIHPLFLISCEHARHDIPEDAPLGGTLGVSQEVVESHVSWDHGAWPIARALGESLDAPSHGGRWSRLFVDLNRSESRDDVVPSTSFGVEVPGNSGLTPDRIENRLERYHRPYRAAVRRSAEGIVGSGHPCLHLSVHSFTPMMNGVDRPYDAGILFDPDRPGCGEVANTFIQVMNAYGLRTLPNAPYPGTVDSIVQSLGMVFPPDLYSGLGIEVSHRVTEAEGGITRVIEALLEACHVLTGSASSRSPVDARAGVPFPATMPIAGH